MFTNEAVQTITTNSCGAMFDHFGPALHDDDDDDRASNWLDLASSLAAIAN